MKNEPRPGSDPAAVECSEHRSGLQRPLGRGALTLLDQAAVSVTRFLLAFLLARYAGKAQYGAYFLAFSSMILLQQTVLAGVVYWPISVLLPQRPPEERPVYLRASLRLLLGFGAGVIAIGGGAALTLTAVGASPSLVEAFRAMAVTSAPVLLQEWVRRTLLASGRQSGALLNDCVQGAVQLGALGVVLWRSGGGGLGPQVAFACLGAGSLIGGLFGLVQLRGDLGGATRPAPSILAENWSFGKWLCGNALLSLGSLELFAYVLAGFRGPEAAAALGACLVVVRLSNPLYLGAAHWVFPHLAEVHAVRGMGGLRSSARSAARVLVGGGLAFSAFLWIAGGPAMRWMYRGRYEGYEGVLVVLGIHVAVRAGLLPASAALAAIRKTHLSFRAYAAGAGLALVLVVPLVQSAGVGGVAWGYLITGGVAAFLSWWEVSRVREAA